MRVYGENWLRPSVVNKLRMTSLCGVFAGIADSSAQLYIGDCTAFHSASGTVMIYTRDSGHHTSGWLKNPDYERCLHLSLSFREPFQILKQASFDEKLAVEWLDLFFADAKRFAWVESAKSPAGQKWEVRHYRVFCDAAWQPMHPRGEVYSREFTEAGWKSFGELHPEDGRQEPSSLIAG